MRISQNTARLIVLALVYFAAARVGAVFVVQPENTSAIWLAGGVGLAALLLAPRAQWRWMLLVIFCTSAFSDMTAGFPPVGALGFALANALETGLGAWVMVRFVNGPVMFARLRDVFALFIIAGAVCAVSGMVGAFVNLVVTGAPFFSSWLVWWFADGMGILIVTPFVLVWHYTTVRPDWQRLRVLEFGLSLFLWTLLANAVFILPEPQDVLHLRPYMLFPVLIWIAFRYTARGVTLAMALLAASVFYAIGASLGTLPLGGKTHTEQILLAQMYVVFLGAMGLLAAALLSENAAARAALSASEMFYRSLADVIPLALCRKDMQARFTFGNRRFLDEMQCSPAELRGKTDFDFFPRELAEQYAASDRRVMERGEAVDAIVAHTTPQGQDMWVHLIKTPLRAANGAVNGIQIVYVDVTERKRAEDALRESQARYQALVETSPDAIGLFDAALNLNMINPAGAALFGYSDASEMLNRTALEFFLPEEQTAVLDAIQHIFDDGLVRNAQFALKHKDGTTFDSEFSAALLTDAQGAPNAIIAITRDITDRKRADQVLHESEAQFRSMFTEHSAVMLIIEPDSGVILDANLAAARFYGYTVAQLRAMNLSELNQLPPQRLASERLRALNREWSSFIFPHRLANGEIRMVEVHSSPIPLADRTVLFSIIHDVTDRTRTEQQMYFLTTHDYLTGVYNRSFFESEMARYEPSREFPISILIADLDNLKTINDQYGHKAGDQLISNAAVVLSATFRSSEIVARIGGDEFAVLLPRTDETAAAQILERLRAQIEHRNQRAQIPLLISLGIATSTQDHLERTFARADARMYAEKQQHKMSALSLPDETGAETSHSI